jgi:spore coat polysaccharide biosynthesis protein SpsF
MNAGILIFSRMSSSRLPGKAMKDFGGMPLVEWVLNRAKGTGLPVALATSDHPEDDVLANYVASAGYQVVRGSLDDVLGRSLYAAQCLGWKAFFRVCGDRPFFDLQEIDQFTRRHLLSKKEPDFDLVTNYEASVPKGLTTELIATQAIERIVPKKDLTESQREHLSSYFYDNSPIFNIVRYVSPHRESADICLAVDTPNDYRVLSAVCQKHPDPFLSTAAAITHIIQLIDPYMTRNYTSYPAQTHLELLIQMGESGVYSSDDLQQCNKAYYLALPCVALLMRGSGKPFITHLVGTASIMVGLNQDVEVVVASLLHAVYQRRVPFPRAETLEARRKLVEAMFGERVEKLVYWYTESEEVTGPEYATSQSDHPYFMEVLTMRLADELEDLSYFGLFTHGNPDDTPQDRGSYVWRREQKRTHIQAMLKHLSGKERELCNAAFQKWIDADPGPRWSTTLKSGQYSSYSL